MSEIVISVEDVGLTYRIERNQFRSIKEFSNLFVKRQIKITQVKALDQVSLTIQKGETYGLIGKNGAGKSTLLKLIAGIIKPTNGRLRVWGNVRALLSVGAGFNYDMTGRENAYMYSSMLGRSDQETMRLFEEIVDFSELEEFIDVPLRTYSTGMVARLGFATALADLPGILLVDEVLAVGDARFQEKCRQRFDDLRKAGATIVIVSHNLSEVERLCQRVAWLERGSLRTSGSPAQVVEEYRNSLGDPAATGVIAK